MVNATRPERLLDVDARAHLVEAVRAAERRTRGEIVLMVVRACDEYGSAGWRLGVALAVAAFCGLHAFAQPLPWWYYLLAQLAGLLLGHGLARLDPLRRGLLGPRLADERVHERARRAFLENGLARTHGRTGILIFVALLERRVVVLRRGQALQGLEAAIHRCGEILVHHFPVSPERNTDELPNAVVIED